MKFWSVLPASAFVCICGPLPLFMPWQDHFQNFFCFFQTSSMLQTFFCLCLQKSFSFFFSNHIHAPCYSFLSAFNLYSVHPIHNPIANIILLICFNLFPPQCSWTQTLISHLCLHEISQLSSGLWFVFPFLVLLPVRCHNPCSAVCAFSAIFSCSALGSTCIFHMQSVNISLLFSGPWTLIPVHYLFQYHKERNERKCCISCDCSNSCGVTGLFKAPYDRNCFWFCHLELKESCQQLK